MTATATLTQLDRHTIASRALNTLIGMGVLTESQRQKGYRRLRAILVRNPFRSAEELVEAIRKNLAAQREVEES